MGARLPEHSIEDDMIIWRADNLRLIGVVGSMERPLEELSSANGLEYAPVIPRTGSDFLAGFIQKPPVDLTIIQDPKVTSLVTISLDEDRSKELLEKIIQQEKFATIPPPRDFLALETVTEMQTLNMCRHIAAMSGSSFEDAFGTVRYTQFLMRYLGHDQQYATAMAAVTYGVNMNPGTPPS